MRESLDTVAKFFKPKFSELNTFIIALTCLLVFISHAEFRSLYGEILVGANAGRATLALIGLGFLSLGGFFLSLFHVFVNWEKSSLEKIMMGVFAALANGLAGIVAGMEMLPVRDSSFLLIFPIWNILMGLLSLYQIGLMQDPVTDENATLFEAVTATFYVLIVFVVADFGLHMTWAMTFSFSMAFAWGMTFFVNWAVNFFNLRRSPRVR